MIPNGDLWAARFLVSEPQYTEASWIGTCAQVFAECKPNSTPGQVTEAAHLASFREGLWNNPKVASGLGALFGPLTAA